MSLHRLAGVLAALALAVTGCPEQRESPRSRPAHPAASSLPAPRRSQTCSRCRRPTGPEWFGLYLVGKKAGFTKVQLARELRDGRDVLVGRSETLVRATVGGKTVERRQEEERVYEARTGGRLLAVRAVWSGDGGDRTVSGTCAARRASSWRRRPPGGRSARSRASPRRRSSRTAFASQRRGAARCAAGSSTSRSCA